MKADGPQNFDKLLREREWLGRLVKSLVDEEATEDVLQDTWVAAFDLPPNVENDPRATRWWLARVAKNFALRDRQAEQRRKHRERTASKSESMPSPAESFDRVRMHRLLAEAVTELEEPFRSTIIWRYYDGLRAEEIAEQLGIPASTVRSRLQRGRDRMRKRLQGVIGEDWHPAIVLAFPLVTKRSVTSASVLATAGKLLVLGAVVALACVAWPEWNANEEVLTQGGFGNSFGAGRFAEQATEIAAVEVASELRAAIPEAGALLRPRLSRGKRLVRGLVLDDRGRRLSGVQVGSRDSTEKTLSNSSGAFVLEAPLGPLELRTSEEFFTLFATSIEGDDFVDGACLVASPAVKVSGRVTDREGRALEGAELLIVSSILPEFPEYLGNVQHTLYEPTTTLADGTFAIDSAPGTDQVFVAVTRPGFAATRFHLSPRDQHGLEIQLDPNFDDDSELVGRVADTQNVPIEGAHIFYACHHVLTDSEGLFRLPWEIQFPRITIVAKGRRPFSANYSHGAWVSDGSPLPIQFVLADEPLSIEGRVLDVNGLPIVGLPVTTQGAYFLSETESAEQLASGSESALVLGITDERGRFRIDGLMERDYEVTVYDPETLCCLRSAAIPAGSTGVELRAQADARYRTIYGRVVDRLGNPTANVEISLSVQVTHGSAGELDSTAGPTHTDHEGRFVLREVPITGALLRLSGPEIIETTFALTPELREDELEILVPRRRLVKFVFDQPSEGAAWLTNESGDEITLNSGASRGFSFPPFWNLADGPSPILAVSEFATLAAVQKGKRKHEQRITLRDDGVTLIHVDSITGE